MPGSSRAPATDWASISRQALLLILAAGCAIRVGWLALGLLKLRLLRRKAHRLQVLPPEVEQRAPHIGRAVEILISPEIPGPATYGVVRSTSSCSSEAGFNAHSEIPVFCPTGP